MLALQNRSGRALEAAWLVLGERVHALGAVGVEPGWSRTLRSERALATGGAPWFDILRRAPPAGDVAGRRLVHAFLRASAWPAPGPQHALLVALAENPLRLAGASASWAGQSRAVVLLELALPASGPERRGR